MKQNKVMEVWHESKIKYMKRIKQQEALERQKHESQPHLLL